MERPKLDAIFAFVIYVILTFEEEIQMMFPKIREF